MQQLRKQYKVCSHHMVHTHTLKHRHMQSHPTSTCMLEQFGTKHTLLSGLTFVSLWLLSQLDLLFLPASVYREGPHSQLIYGCHFPTCLTHSCVCGPVPEYVPMLSVEQIKVGTRVQWLIYVHNRRIAEFRYFIWNTEILFVGSLRLMVFVLLFLLLDATSSIAMPC